MTLTSIPALRGARVVVVAGPGVLAARAAGGVRALAGITGATVVNTVGAKGLFRWDDPLHGGTVGLQEGDAELAEITTADLVVTTGLDPAESVGLTAALAARAAADPTSVVDVPPAHLAFAAGGWPPADGPGARPPVYAALAAVVGPLYETPGTPPARARALAEALPAGGLVVAPPGPTGFWLGRTFPTSAPGSVLVTTGRPDGTAEAVATEAVRSGRPTVLVLEEGAAAPPEEANLRVEHWPTDTASLALLVNVAGPPDPAVWP